MSHTPLHLISPALKAIDHTEAEIFTSVTWLALHGQAQSRLGLYELSKGVIPAIRAQQYILATASDGRRARPVAFVSWALMSAEVETRYLQNPDDGLRLEEWCSGNRMWVLNWLTPFGHGRTFSRILRTLWADHCLRYLQRKRGLCIHTLRGANLAGEQARQWACENPLRTEIACIGIASRTPSNAARSGSARSPLSLVSTGISAA
jgi:cytolysin-activating lysine-acyltransferase